MSVSLSEFECLRVSVSVCECECDVVCECM